MSRYSEIEPMEDPSETLERLCGEAANKVNREYDLPERERDLLMFVLGIREFSRALRNSMDEDGQVFAGFDETLAASVFIPGDELWSLVDNLAECVLDGIGELERFDPEAAASRREVQAFLARVPGDARRRAITKPTN